jgi:hypothetical protein
LKACPCEVRKQNRAAPFLASIEEGLAVITGNAGLHQSFNLFESENVPRCFVAVFGLRLGGKFHGLGGIMCDNSLTPRCVEGNFGHPAVLKASRLEDREFGAGRGPDPLTKDNASGGADQDPLQQ